MDVRERTRFFQIWYHMQLLIIVNCIVREILAKDQESGWDWFSLLVFLLPVNPLASIHHLISTFA